MSGTKPPKGPGKPFLFDEDLESDLDAWDATFDNLHTEGPGAAEPAMTWPSPATPGIVDLSPPVKPQVDADASGALANFTPSNEFSGDEPMTIERAVAIHTDEDELAAPGPGETDFSDMGAEGVPSALGDLLGQSTRPHPIPVDDDGSTGIRVAPTFPVKRQGTEDDADVFTSASRPAFRAPDDGTLEEDTVTRPPIAVPPERRGPAIVRRNAPTAAPGKRPPPPPGAKDRSRDFAEETQVQDLDELEAQRVRSQSPTSPPPMADEDYADIEIGASPAPPVSHDASSPVRRTAHIVRRAETPARAMPVAIPVPAPMPMEIAVEASDIVELQVDEPPDAVPEVEVATEDDLAIPVEPAPPTAIPAVAPVPEPASDLVQALAGLVQPGAKPGVFDGKSDPVIITDKPVADPEPAGRPPDLRDLYPRVKTPTSVPQFRIPRAPSVSGDQHAEPELSFEGVGVAWPEQLDPLPTAVLDEAAAKSLLVYERELATIDESGASAALRTEAGRLCERLGDSERARTHYEAALLADPRATSALRGLRRLARGNGDLVEAVRHLDAEIAVAGALERRPLGHHRIDMLMAIGDQDLARVAVGEVLDQAPSDVRALLAHLELAFLDGRADEFGKALEKLATAVTDPALRAAVLTARGALAAQHNDDAAATRWFAAAADADDTGLGARIGAVRHAAAGANTEASSTALLDLARRVQHTDPLFAAAAALRAMKDAAPGSLAAASSIALACFPEDSLVARIAAETARGGASGPAGDAFAHWAKTASTDHDRIYATAQAAELIPTRAIELWSTVLEAEPDNDYAAAQLRTAHVALEATQAAIDVDLAIAADPDRDRARLRAAYGLIALGKLDDAIAVLRQGHAARPGSLALTEALAEALAAAGRWGDRAQLFAELVSHPGEQLDPQAAALRSALAWEEAVGAAAAEGGDSAALQQTTVAALDAWERVLESSPSPTANAAAIVLASRLSDRDVLAEALSRAQASETQPWALATLALRRARLYSDDAARSESVIREITPNYDDPRRTLALMLAGARQHELADVIAALEERASLLNATTSAVEIATLRLRAAQLALDAQDPARATMLLGQVEASLPQLAMVADIHAAARRRSGDRPRSSSTRPPSSIAPGGDRSSDAFTQLVREADLAAGQGDHRGALALYQRALEVRPGDPVAAVPLVRVASELRDPEPVTAVALARLRAAEAAGDGIEKAAAYELLATIDSELRGDLEGAQISLESATQADPSRLDLLRRLERAYVVTDQLGELIRTRRLELDATPSDHAADRAALLMDLASLSARDHRTDLELADLYRGALEIDPKTRLALMQLETIVRRSGASEQLATLEVQIASYFDGDPRSQAAFWTRSGETLAEVGQVDAAVGKFGLADAALPGYAPALESWRQTALKGQLWVDAAEAATRQANNADDAGTRAQLHHFAGVVLMDKALVGERATASFRRALAADPNHRDAFVRLRMLLEEQANHDDLATLLAQRLELEADLAARCELHRALAELHRNFLSDREIAKRHFRAIIEVAPGDAAAHAAIADIAWEQGNWQEAADALMARARLEHDSEVLKTLCFRLGLLYADRLNDLPMAVKAFQRALSYQPDDENTLIRIADLATQAGEWRHALGACERLVKNETDPDRRAMHLHRVARIFRDGFGDMKRAERALNLALDGAPTSEEALSELVSFYRQANDMVSVRVHLNRAAGAMRNRAAQNPSDGIAYRVISRAMTARAAANVPGSKPIAHAAAELADLLGESGEPERHVLATAVAVEVAALVKPETDELLFPRGVPVELRQIFGLLGERIAKHVGVDLRPYGMTRGDRLRAKDSVVASVAQTVATGLGLGEIDIYVSSRQPWAVVAEPTSPVSLIIGSSIGGLGGDAVRFAAASALKLAHASLAIPARLPPAELGVLVVSLIRLFQPDFPIVKLDADAIAAQTQKLRRLIPTALVTELKPFGLAIDSQRFDHHVLARDLKIAGLRAGLVASGALIAGLRIAAGQVDVPLPGFLSDPTAQGLISFALSDDYGSISSR